MADNLWFWFNVGSSTCGKGRTIWQHAIFFFRRRAFMATTVFWSWLRQQQVCIDRSQCRWLHLKHCYSGTVLTAHCRCKTTSSFEVSSQQDRKSRNCRSQYRKARISSVSGRRFQHAAQEYKHVRTVAVQTELVVWAGEKEYVLCLSAFSCSEILCNARNMEHWFVGGKPVWATIVQWKRHRTALRLLNDAVML